MNLTRNRRQLFIIATLALAAASLLYFRSSVADSSWISRKPASQPPLQQSKPLKALADYTRTLVIGRLQSEDVSWLDRHLPDLNRTIYVVDDPSANPSVPKNKGHEAMVYLTYIIDHYDSLPDTVLFFHPHQITWHNNILLDLNAVTTISRLSDARVARNGYFNSRCHLDPGCPDWLHIDRPEAEWDFVKKTEERYFTSALWRELHPDKPIPHAISQPCCAQFAVSGERIRTQPKAEYMRLREWLLATPLSDTISGRIMEYTWQYIFTGDTEYCPSQSECYCDGYGICFGGDAELQAWLDILRKQERVDEEVRDLKSGADDEDANEERLAELGRMRQEYDDTLRKLKAEAYERGNDPRNRALGSGRPWKEGDGF